jgi:CRISPR system Cascade subunit CasC
MKIELHLIQNFAPSCLNRDDTNQPKDCEFGGVRRARISSQCIKKAIRDYWRGHELCAPLATRSRWERDQLRQRISPYTQDPDALLTPVGRFLDMLASAKAEKEEGEEGEAPQRRRRSAQQGQDYERCAALSWLSDAELQAVVTWVAEHADEVQSARRKDDKKKLAAAFAKAHEQLAFGPDIALFGRMMANVMAMQVHSACQVAHAISTHRVDMDMDFYTAVDDLNPESETGAGMVGVTGFNSACFYRYVLVHRPQLVHNLGGDEALADDVIKAFLLASVYAIPTGKQNSMAAQNLPSFGMFVVRSNSAPCSLANAFAEPVRIRLGDDEDLVGRSIEALSSYWSKLNRVYGADGVLATSLFHDGRESRLGDLAACDRGSVGAAVAATMEAVRSAGG